MARIKLAAPVTVKLLKPHTHGLTKFKKDDLITVEDHDAEHLVQNELAEYYNGDDGLTNSKNLFDLQHARKTLEGDTASNAKESADAVAEGGNAKVVDGTGEDGNAPVDPDAADTSTTRTTRRTRS